MKRVTLAAALCLGLALTAPAFAAPTAIPGLHRFRLSNGLELFVLQNSAVPLTRIQITFRCGSITQTPETAGLFHLYEHMLFKGNARYPTETDFSAAMTELGVSEWNGGTSTEYVTYYFTVPSDKTEAGLEFWSYAVREPLFDAAELSIEQGVVANEINGYKADPDHVYSAAMDKALFSSYPWRRDIGGNEATVRAATVESLRSIQASYYIPNNAALFVGGDVEPEAVLAMAERWYGSWKAGPDPWAAPPRAHPAPRAPVFLAYPDESLPEGIAYLEARYRGPDVLVDTPSTYAADVWGYLIQAPDGRFKASVYDAVPALYEKDYLGAYYYTQRDGGQVSFYAYCFVDPAFPLADRAKKAFAGEAIPRELAAIKDDASYFPGDDFSIVKVRLEDEQIFGLETPDHFIETLSFWWAVASADYFLGYAEAMRSVTTAHIGGFIDRYLLGAEPIVALRLHPADYAIEAASLAAAGFSVITPDNAFWWKE